MSRNNIQSETKPVEEPQSKLRRFCKAGLASVAAAVLVLFTGVLPVQAAERANDRPVLVLDAGHGGQDPGALDITETVLEADIAQHLTDRLVKLFSRHTDEVDVVLTHEAGETTSIGQRTAVANAVDADLFVSLHLNAAENRDASGFQIFPAVPGRANHAESLQLAEDILTEVRETGIEMRGNNSVFYCYYRGGVKEFYDGTATNLPGNLKSFGVLEGVDCPSVLVEQWFMTSPSDMAKYNNTEGKDMMALALYRGICQYLDIEPKA